MIPDPINTDVIQGTLDMLILKTLSLEPMHGFGIARRIEQISRGVFKVNPGSLLTAFQRLERAGLTRRRVAPDRQRTPGQVLHADPERPEAARGRDRRLGSPRGCRRAPVESRELVSIRRHISRGLRVLFRRHAQDDDLDREMRHYLEEAAGAFEARGLTPAEARCAARREMGDPVAVREQVRDAGWESRIASLIFDVRFAGRMLRKTPVFTLTLVLVIAIGSGAVTTIFSAMNAILLRPLPGVEAIDRLVSLRHARQDGSTLEQGSYAFYAYARDRTTTLDGVAAWGRVALTLSTGDGGTAVSGNMVSASYFSLLGVRPALGRFFADDEDRTPDRIP